MDDDARRLLGIGLAFLDGKARLHGNLRAKTTGLEKLRLVGEAIWQIDQQENAHKYHAGRATFGQWLTADFDSAAEAANNAAIAAVDFQQLAAAFIEYLGSVRDPAQHRQGVMLFGIMAIARHGGGPILPTMQPPPRPEAQRIVYEPPEPPHPHAELFSPYLNDDPQAASERIARYVATIDRSMAVKLLRRLVEYAVTLRDKNKLARAFALSNTIFYELRQKAADEQKALPPPEKH